MPEQPDINASYVTAFKVMPSKGETFEAVYNKNRAQYKDYEGWDITPVYGKTMPGSASVLQNQFSGLASLSCTDGVTYKATSSDKKKYGLDLKANPLGKMLVTGFGPVVNHFMNPMGEELSWYKIQFYTPGKLVIEREK